MVKKADPLWRGSADRSMPNPLVAKLSQFSSLSLSERDALDHLLDGRIGEFRAGEDLMRAEKPPPRLHVLLSGWACRYLPMPDGRRPILAFLLPGDVCDYGHPLLDRLDHWTGAITAVRAALVPYEAVRELCAHHAAIGNAWSRAAYADAAIQRQWIVNLGKRDAFERIAHLLCEFHYRLRGIGLLRGAQCDFPLTQVDLSDATGMTPVHINRTLQELRARGLIHLKGKILTIPRLDALEAACQFDRTYLHLGRPADRTG